MQRVAKRLKKRRFGLQYVLLVGLVFALGAAVRIFFTSNDIQPLAHSRHLTQTSIIERLDGYGCEEGSQLKHYGVPLWLFLLVFCFVGIAIVCDDYFIETLDQISIALNLSDDVAGATFMAAGSSAPELFISLLGVFLKEAEDNPGPGTIVGSAVFNLTIVVSVTILLSGSDSLTVTWWPLTRDSAFYVIAIVLMIVSFVGTTPGRIHWWEALTLMLTYAVYIIFMKFNKTIVDKIEFREKKTLQRAYDRVQRLSIAMPSPDVHSYQDGSHDGLNGITVSERTIRDDADEQYSMHICVDKSLQLVLYIMAMPWNLLFRITIPDTRKPGWARWYPVGFIMSVLWIAVISYFMIDGTTKLGDCLGMSATIMGLTLLAAGTSVPDAIASILVARDGKGDMAIANLIGSNVFDILIGLGFPWILKALIDGPVEVETTGLTEYSVILFAILVVVISLFAATNFVLKRWIGWALAVVYIVYIAFGLVYDVVLVDGPV